MSESLRQTPVDVVLPEYGVFALESHHAAGFRMQPSRHEFLEVFYVLNGSGRFVLDGRPWRCRPGDVIAVPPGTCHAIEDDARNPLSLYGVCVAPGAWRHDASISARLPVGRLPRNQLLRSQIQSDLRILLFEQTLRKPWSSTVILGLTLRLLGLLLRARDFAKGEAAPATGLATEGCRETVRMYVHELERRFFEHADLEQAATRLGMSRRRFTQLFREETGRSWLAYVQRLRMDHACRLLSETRRTIASIAFECGYDSLSSFYRIFRQQTGRAPALWRQTPDARAAPSARIARSENPDCLE